MLAVLAILAAPAAAAVKPAKAAKPAKPALKAKQTTSATPLVFTTCQTVLAWSTGNKTFPWPGTMFCPTTKAFDRFAKASGYHGWDELWKTAQANPLAWKPYLKRLVTYSYVPAYTLMSAIPKGKSSLDTALADSVDGTTQETLSLSRASTKGRVTVMNQRSGSGNAGRARVTHPNYIRTSTALVHGVDDVIMAPETFYTVHHALKAMRGVKNMAKLLRKHLRDDVQRAGTWATFVLPTDDAWAGLKLKDTKLPVWLGGISEQKISSHHELQQALVKYSTVPMPAWDNKGVLTYASLYKTWQLADAGANYGQNFVAFPTTLQVSKTRQLSHYTFDHGLQKMYAVGARNFNADNIGADSNTYMAGGELVKTTIFAGCSSILTTTTYIPLPVKTGVSEFDDVAA